MTSRFDIERAVLTSDLPKSARLLMFVLLAHADNDTAEIRPRYSPSLTCLAQESGLARSTVQSTLRELEAAGWVKRRRPAVEQSRKGARTRYRLAAAVATEHADLGRSPTQVDTKVGRSPTQARSTTDLGVGRPSVKPRSVTDPLNTIALTALDTQRADARPSDPSRNGKPQPPWLDGAIDHVAARLSAVTGRTYERRDIAESVRGFLRGKTVSSPAGYIRKCADDNPLQFEPTPGPPQYRKEDYQ